MSTYLEIMARSFRAIEIPDMPPHDDPRKVGVYLLVDGGDIVYVGSSGDLGERIYQHVRANGHSNPLQHKVFNAALWLPLPWRVCFHYEGAFIRRIAPRFNRTAPKYYGHDNEILEGFGLEPHADPASVARAWVMFRNLRHRKAGVA